MIAWLEQDTPFPLLSAALKEPNGLLAMGGDLSCDRLLDAYKQGIFPWFSEGQPILWWSPDPRMVLFPNELTISRSLKKLLKKHPFKIHIDTAFDAVMESCAAPRAGQEGTWITPMMRAAYGRLYELGYAHSVEVWLNDELVGGLYGVAIGHMFYGESMFSFVPNASKIALIYLVRHIERYNFGMIDCQMSTPHLASFGAREIAREEFVQKLQELVNYPAEMNYWKEDPNGVNE